jgi:formate/nitrite transporter FocA (FNT family)
MSIGKIIAMYIPIFTFIACGLEHSIANAFFIPASMMMGGNITFKQLFLNNLLPVILGNIIGGGICVAFSFWYVHGFRQKYQNYSQGAHSKKNFFFYISQINFLRKIIHCE